MEDEFENKIGLHKYFVICEDDTMFIYKSLRDISKNTDINYSTISKKLKNKNNCFCKSKKNKLKYFINRIEINN